MFYSSLGSPRCQCRPKGGFAADLIGETKFLSARVLKAVNGGGPLVQVQNSGGVPRFSSRERVELTWDPADAQALVE